MHENLNFANYKLFWQNNKETHPPAPKHDKAKKTLATNLKEKIGDSPCKVDSAKLYNWKIVIAKSWKIKIAESCRIFWKANCA
jgi:hypothetical protein